MKNASHITLLVGTALVLSACSGAKVAVPTEFPVPLVRGVPVQVGWHLDDALTGYVYEETIEGAGEFLIDLGPAQRPMFQRLSEGLFAGHRFVDGVEGHTGLNGVLQPSIAELQFSTPKQTRTEYYEVWIRYQFKLFNPDGTLRGEWPLMAYGKAHTQNYGVGAQAALQAAAVAACRDAIAYFSLHFHNVPVVKTWLAEQNPGSPT